jgi:hypothetical protein
LSTRTAFAACESFTEILKFSSVTKPPVDRTASAASFDAIST